MLLAASSVVLCVAGVGLLNRGGFKTPKTYSFFKGDIEDSRAQRLCNLKYRRYGSIGDDPSPQDLTSSSPAQLSESSPRISTTRRTAALNPKTPKTLTLNHQEEKREQQHED